MVVKENPDRKKKVQNFFDLREKIINLFKDYYLLFSEAKYKPKLGRGLKILTSKQITKKVYNNIMNLIKL